MNLSTSKGFAAGLATCALLAATQAATTGARTNTLRAGLESFNVNPINLLQGKPFAETPAP